MKKKILRTLSIFLALFLIMGVVPIEVNAVATSADFKYRILEDGTIRITSYIGNDTIVNIPENINGRAVTTISKDCFFYSDAKETIEKIVIPKTIKFINNNIEVSDVFKGNGHLKEIVVDKDNPYFTSDDGVLYNKSKTILFFCPIAKDETEFIVPSSVSEIYRAAFVYNHNIKSIKFSGELEYISDSAFSHIWGLTNFEYPKVKSHDPLLTNCREHIDVIIPKNIINMHDLDFAGTDVTLYVYPDSYGLEWAQNHDFEYVIIEELKGDIDNDGEITIKDATSIQSYIAKFVIDTEFNMDVADMDNDGEVTIKDATNVQMIVAKLV